MKTESLVWMAVLAAGLLGLAVRAASVPMGRVYVRAEEHRYLVPVAPSSQWRKVTEEKAADGQGRLTVDEAGARRVVTENEIDRAWTTHVKARPNEAAEPDVQFSTSRTVALWIAAGLTLCALSFLWGDNVFFKLMQAIIVGVSAGYYFVTLVWSQLIPNLFGKLFPDLIGRTFVPGILGSEAEPIMWIPLALGLMMLWRLSPVGGWISRFPMAFFIGLLAGVNLVNIFKADFLEQVKSTILPLIVVSGGGVDLGQSLKNAGLVAGVLCSLTYFFFSVEHRGPVGVAARVGVCVLMITFGASFGLTVMTRITIFSQRLQFLFDDWLWLIDPLGNR